MTVTGIDVSPRTTVETAPRRRLLRSPPSPPWVPITICLRPAPRLVRQRPSKETRNVDLPGVLIHIPPLVRLRTSIAVDRLMAAASSGQISLSRRNSAMAHPIPYGGSLYDVRSKASSGHPFVPTPHRIGEKPTGGGRKRFAPLSISSVDRPSYQANVAGRIQRDLFRERPVKDSGAVGPV